MLRMGQPEETLLLIDPHLVLDPTNPEERGWAMLQRGRAYMAMGHYDNAIAACERAIALDDWWLPRLFLLSGYALKGETTKVAAEEAALVELRPGTTIADFKRLYGSNNLASVQQTETHLFAGLPEQYESADPKQTQPKRPREAAVPHGYPKSGRLSRQATRSR